MSQPIDLRSDTVTLPDSGMRKAMANAEVGDDVYGEDPTVNALQEQIADITGKDAALFVPSGTMGNQIGIHIHTRPGDSVVAGCRAHVAWHEVGAPGLISGVQMELIPGNGTFTGAELRAHYRGDDLHAAPTSLVTVENTHNEGGGIVWPLDKLAEVVEVAEALGIRTHLDGARLWNASVASGVPVADWCAGFDTVSLCLSKGLGAPVGSVLAGSKDQIRRALRARKRFGGGMRQAGILAAAARYALANNLERLAEDHDNALYLAEHLANIKGITIHCDSVQTNIILVHVECDSEALRIRAQEKGLLFWPRDERSIRLVTHLGIDRNACKKAVDILASLF